MKMYKIYVSGLYVGCLELSTSEVNNMISDKNIIIIEKN